MRSFWGCVAGRAEPAKLIKFCAGAIFGVRMNEENEESVPEKLIGKGRITAWIILGGLFVLLGMGAVPADRALELIGYIAMAVLGVQPT